MFAVGGALLIAAAAVYFIDADPPWLFENPLVPGILTLLAIAVVAFAWRAG